MSGHSRKIILAERARKDLLEILELSLELWGPQQMDAYAATIDRTIARLAHFPDIGAQINHVMPGLRRVRVEHHVVYYSHDDEVVSVHRILHERRQVTKVQFHPESDE
ncbi:MAG TPA: type II toxin-antitoxin system RelE/ParE family toxin [Thermomicrobiales bacterium]|nr:type II toxin-antitoxin system RelE/ParE family toxin [Thermomicrobiales bacterium]